ncbi:cactus-binding carboxy-terminal [Perilla frutescens var. hirtella]|uniref:Cactus-binding carboxy-terminal n=1 Tax=Perilla frutescens var. hirtella TaxID=608512 RepID=A0AAD4J8V4_PERFH|nr:cactus-binding carboxy-terminal [Perilla frutescens var. hirtella]
MRVMIKGGDEIREYVVKKAARFAKKFESEFVWEKKIRHDLGRGVAALDDLFSIEALNKRRENAKMELEKVRERREKQRKKIHEAQSQPQPQRARSQDDGQDHDRVVIEREKEREVGLDLEEGESGDDELVVIGSDLDVDHLKKPKFLNRVRTGYHWNRYNRIHYDGDNPPPKAVQGYKFDIFYPDLLSTPSYSIERDDVDETCILRFHAGEPYQDIAFRIVNAEWDYSAKNGFKCTFESGTLRLHFNLKRLRYRR